MMVLEPQQQQQQSNNTNNTRHPSPYGRRGNFHQYLPESSSSSSHRYHNNNSNNNRVQQQQQYDPYTEHEVVDDYGGDAGDEVVYDDDYDDDYDDANNVYYQHDDEFQQSPQQQQRSGASVMSASSSTLPFDQRLDHSAGLRFYEDESASQPGKILPGRTSSTQAVVSSPRRSHPWTSQQRTTPLPTSTMNQYRLSPPRISVPLSYPYTTQDDDGMEDEEEEDRRTRTMMMEEEEEDHNHQRNLQHMGFVQEDEGEDHLHHHPAVIVDDEPSALTMEVVVAQPMDVGQQQQQQKDVDDDDEDSLFDFVEGTRRRRSKRAVVVTPPRTSAAAAAARGFVPSYTHRGATAAGDDDDEVTKETYDEETYGDDDEATKETYDDDDEVTKETYDTKETYGDETYNTNEDGTATKEDTATFDSSYRSVASTYTKSAESEVEDIIKDIFMIGSGQSTVPGRRRVVRSTRTTHQQLTDNETVDTYGNTILPTAAAAAPSTTAAAAAAASKRRSAGQVSEEDADDEDEGEEDKEDLVAQTLEFVGGKLSVAAAAIAWSVQQSMTSPTTKGPATTTATTPSSSTPATRSAAAMMMMDAEPTTDGNINSKDTAHKATGATTTTRTTAEDSGTNTDTDDDAPASWNLLQRASDALFGDGVGLCETDGGVVDGNPSLEDDVRLVDLAIQAAVSAHRLKGVEFDHAHDIDIASEIKFSVVDLALPLGLIFQENEKGCWVTRILAQGNAARLQSNIQVGDQLAAVDGSSAIDLTVDEIAALIRKKRKVIELTFVRYVGQLRPAMGTYVQEEGYEIQATEAFPVQETSLSGVTRRKKQLAWSSDEMQSEKPNSLASSGSPKSILKNSHDVFPDATAAERPRSPISELSPVSFPESAPSLPTGQSSMTSSQMDGINNTATTPKKRFRLFGRRR